MSAQTLRQIEFTHSAYTGGPIHGVLGTDQLRKRLNPFVFLDHFDVTTEKKWGFDWHPHSGVATFTYVLASDLDHVDTGGSGGRLSEGGVQWMAAGGGIWHQEFYEPRLEHRVNGLQLWIALPPGLENGPTNYQHAQSEDLPVVGDTRILVGTYEGVSSPIQPPVSFNYFDVTLDAAQSWEFAPPADHDIAWLYCYDGTLAAGGTVVPSRTIGVFEPGSGTVVVAGAGARASFVIGTAAASSEPIVASGGSMHTNFDALKAGQRRISELAVEVKNR